MPRTVSTSCSHAQLFEEEVYGSNKLEADVHHRMAHYLAKYITSPCPASPSTHTTGMRHTPGRGTESQSQFTLSEKSTRFRKNTVRLYRNCSLHCQPSMTKGPQSVQNRMQKPVYKQSQTVSRQATKVCPEPLLQVTVPSHRKASHLDIPEEWRILNDHADIAAGRCAAAAAALKADWCAELRARRALAVKILQYKRAAFADSHALLLQSLRT